MNLYKITKTINDLNFKGATRVSNLVKKIMLPKMKSGMIITTLYGFKMKIDPIKDIAVERNLFYYGTYEEGTLEILQKLIQKGDTFVDIGANIGLMSLFVAHTLNDNCSIIAFEPNPKTNELLEFNVSLNKFSCINIQKLAIGSENKSSTIYDIWEGGRGSSSLIKPDNENGSYEIIETTLDDYFSKNQPIDIIKIDIEGYEINALKGAKNILSRKNAPAVILEYSVETGKQADKHDIYNFILSLNRYRIFKHTIWKGVVCPLKEIYSTSDLPTHDNIYCLTNDHIERLPKSLFLN